MKGIINFLLFLVLVGTMSCSGGAYDGLNREQRKVARDVAKRYNQFISKIGSGELDHLEDYFSTDQRFSWEFQRREGDDQFETEYPNRIQLVETMRQDYQKVRVSKVTSSPGKVTVYNENNVHIVAMYYQTERLQSGEVKKYQGAISAYMIKEGDTWRFLKGLDHNGLKDSK